MSAANGGALLLMLWAATGRAAPALNRIDAALEKGAAFLLKQQGSDGAWRSTTYGAMKDGTSLTPVAVKALWFGSRSPEAKRAVDQGLDFLAHLVDEKGAVNPGPDGMAYPVYSAAVASIVLGFSPVPEHRRARDGLLEFLRQRQLDERNGWSPADSDYGGWGYYLGVPGAFAVPTKPPTGAALPPMLSSNVSSTVMVVGALGLSGVGPDDPSLARARLFIERMQNFAADPADADPEFDDGGFHFTPDDLVENKPGAAGKDRHGRARFRSYGSMTADGLRALLRLGYAPEHPRIAAAAAWLTRNFSARQCPGKFSAVDEERRESVFFYWSWTAGHALRALGASTLRGPRGRVNWAAEMTEELLSRQRPDGSWGNRFKEMREDDPLVATPLAMAALGNARWALAADGP
jgi:squalene-hopene/tetraprenyl-beta-curcumene cyclase